MDCKKVSNTPVKKNLISYGKVLTGSVSIAAGIYFFLAPSQFAAGGISGLAIILRRFFPQVPISFFVLIMDAFLFLLGFFLIGAKFGGKSVVSSATIVVSMGLFEVLVPRAPLFSHDYLVMLLFGTFFTAFGQALLFNQNASSGGTDIIAKIISRYTHLKIAVSLRIVDMTVVLLATSLIDYYISGFSVGKYVAIVPSSQESALAITEYILRKLDRGATTYEGKGAYSQSSKSIITTVVGTKEFIRLRHFIADTDKKAFVTVQNLHEVLGEGFTPEE